MKNFKETLKRIFGGYDLNDLFMFAGIILLGWGVWQIYHPAAFILTGAGLFWWGYRSSLIKARRK